MNKIKRGKEETGKEGKGRGGISEGKGWKRRKNDG